MFWVPFLILQLLVKDLKSTSLWESNLIVKWNMEHQRAHSPLAEWVHMGWRSIKKLHAVMGSSWRVCVCVCGSGHSGVQCQAAPSPPSAACGAQHNGARPQERSTSPPGDQAPIGTETNSCSSFSLLFNYVPIKATTLSFALCASLCVSVIRWREREEGMEWEGKKEREGGGTERKR